MAEMTLEEALAAAEVDNAPVNDIITIDPETRAINLPSSEMLFGVEQDKDVERKYFKCPRIVGDNIDLSTHQIYIAYVTAKDRNGSFDRSAVAMLYYCEDMTLDETGSYIKFSWKLSENVFDNPGFVAFAVSAKYMDGDALKTRWKTTPAVGTVLMTVPDNGKIIAELYPDIIAQLIVKMEAVEEIATPEAMQGYVNTYLAEHPAELDETLTDNTKAAPAGLVGELKGDIKQVSDEMKNLDVRSIADIQKTASELLVDTYTITYTDGTSSTFEVTNGSSDEAYVASIINLWLDKHPEATTTVQPGTIDEEKLTDELKKKMQNTFRMATTHPIGRLFDTDYDYNSWVHNNVKYDSANDKIVVLWSASSGHTETDRHIMMAKVNPRTFEAEEIKVVYDNDGVGANVATYGFEILDDGTYITFISVYDSSLEYYGKVVACKSSDYGKTWTFTEVTANNLTSNASYEFFGLTKLSTGRLLMIEYNTKTFMYSDDNGKTWECTITAQRLHEPCFIEHSDGSTIVCYGRKTMYGTSNGAYNGTKQIEPALWWISTDSGTTWTAKGDSSTITEMTSSNCCVSVNDGYIDLYVCSRMPHGDAFGVIYHYYASEDDAINDNWGTPKVVLYPSCATGQDFSYIGCCLDSDKNTHIFYYDSDGVEGETGIYYMVASKNPVAIPANADMTRVLSLPYSIEKVDALLTALKTSLQSQINKLIIQGGGTIEGGSELTGEYFVTDGLGEWWDFTEQSSYSEEDATYKGLLKETVLYVSKASWGISALDDAAFDPTGLRYYAGIFNKTDLSADYPYENGVTLEMMVHIDVAHTSNITTSWIAYLSGNNFGYPQFNSAKNLYFTKYKKTDGSSDSSASTGNNGDVYLSSGWFHWVLTIDGVESKLYLNGKLVTSMVYAEKMTDFASLSYEAMQTFTISAGNDSTGAVGSVTSCRLYQKVLSAEEVKNNYTYERNLNA